MHNLGGKRWGRRGTLGVVEKLEGLEARSAGGIGNAVGDHNKDSLGAGGSGRE